jgi:hypothetical protein
MDRHLFNKLKFLDREERVDNYAFFTNFTIPKTSHIVALHVSGLAIGIYGHDVVSFKDITRSTEIVYFRLVRHLEPLLRMKERGTTCESLSSCVPGHNGAVPAPDAHREMDAGPGLCLINTGASVDRLQ